MHALQAGQLAILWRTDTMKRVAAGSGDPHLPDYVWQCQLDHNGKTRKFLDTAWGEDYAIGKYYNNELQTIRDLRNENIELRNRKKKMTTKQQAVFMTEHETFFRYPPITVVLHRMHTGAAFKPLLRRWLNACASMTYECLRQHPP